MTTRSRLFTLLAIIAVLSLALLTGCGGDDGDSGSSEDAKALLEKAFQKQVDSGDLRVDLRAELDGLAQVKGPVALTLGGPYRSNGTKEIPELDWDISAEFMGQDFKAGLIVAPDNAYVEYGGESYEVGSDVFAQFKKQFEEQQEDQPQSLKALGADPASWLEDATLEDGEAIGGDSTRLISGSVSVEKMVRDIFDLLRSPAVRSQLENQGQTVPDVPKLSDEDIDRVKEAVDDLKLEANVDESDALRRLQVEVDFSVPEGEDAGQLEGGTISFEYVLEEVGTDPAIEAPSNPKPLNELMQQFGGLGGLGGGVTPGAPLQTP